MKMCANVECWKVEGRPTLHEDWQIFIQRARLMFQVHFYHIFYALCTVVPHFQTTRLKRVPRKHPKATIQPLDRQRDLLLLRRRKINEND
jgi:hypothetical protein